MTQLRPELPELPKRIKRLPVDRRGYPVPWFVEWHVDGAAVPIGQGVPDFRIMSNVRLGIAFREKRCWVCGDKLGRYKAFTLGPMCAVNRTSAEPPSHRDCAIFSATACPFLTRPHARRREAGLPEDIDVDNPNVAGTMLKRNPGVALVWVTEDYNLFRAPNGTLVRIGEPTETLWYCEGREATRDEIMASIDSGLPALREVADKHNEGEALDAAIERAMLYVPA